MYPCVQLAEAFPLQFFSFSFILFSAFLLLQEEAEKLLKNSSRCDLLNKFYQASNQWTKVRNVLSVTIL